MDGPVNNFNTPEISLRRAVALAPKNTSNPGNLAASIKSAAFEQLDLIAQAQGLINGLQSDTNLQKEAIGLAVQGIEIAYHVLSNHMLETSFQRKQFVDECENFIVTFTLNKDKEKEDYYDEEVAIQKYWELIQKENKGFTNYFGIQATPNTDNPKITRLSVMPFFRMSQSLPQKSLVASELDQHQYAIYLFLKTGLPNTDYHLYYHLSSRLWLKLESFWAKQNYLNRFRAPLFIINSLANLLWNLQHPIDAETGMPLTLIESVNLCVKGELFINNLLDEYQHSIFFKIDKHQQIIHDYLLKVERLIKSLHAAFQYESLHEINLSDVSSSMHRGCRIMANKMLELIYQRPSAAESLLGQIMYLGEMLIQTPMLIEKAFPNSENKGILGLNSTPCTLTDVLILFSHMKPRRRQDLYLRLKSETKDVYLELARVLQKLDQEFLVPFEILILKPSEKTAASTTDEQSGIARYFISLLCLLMECFTIFNDTRSKEAQTNPNLKSDNQQREFIIKMSASSNHDKYYRWSLSLFLQNHDGSSMQGLDQLLNELNQMRMMTELLDKLGSIVLENRILLQQKTFQQTIITTLKKIRGAYRDINNRLNRVEDAMNRDELIQRNEKRILQPMLDDVEATIESIQLSISQVSQVINNPAFTEEQRKEMQDKIDFIQNEFHNIFQEQLVIPVSLPVHDIPEHHSLGSSELRTPTIKLTEQKSPTTALIHLVQKCYEGLSSWSKNHPKGRSLINLQIKLQNEDDLTADQIKQYFLDIIKLTASPRRSYFFQAAYGQTRSAKVLIQTILDEKFNNDLPIASILFNNPNIRLKTLTEAQVLQKINELQTQNHWDNLAPDKVMCF